MRARMLSVVVAGAVLALGPVPSAVAAPVDAGVTNLGDCDTDLVRPAIEDRDVEKKRGRKSERRERNLDLVPRVYTPDTNDSEGDEDYRALRGGVLGEDEDRDENRKRKGGKKRLDTNNLSIDGGLSLLCR